MPTYQVECYRVNEWDHPYWFRILASGWVDAYKVLQPWLRTFDLHDGEGFVAAAKELKPEEVLEAPERMWHCTDLETLTG